MNYRLPFLLLSILFSSFSTFAQKEKDEPQGFEDDLVIRWVDQGDTAFLVAVNQLYAPLEVILDVKNQDEKSFLIEPLDSAVLMSHPKIIIGKKSGSIQINYRIDYHMGHPDLTKVDLDYPYRFPFEKGKAVSVSQGWRGKATHNTSESLFAIDFQMDEGEKVFAAREGTVVKVIDWFTKRGGPKYGASGNEIIILHEDGTFASYLHLQYQGSVVLEGDFVNKGQHIGFSGQTGYATGPHLHFFVTKERGIAIPYYFEGYPKQELEEGKAYQH
ncbi:M23 family metallopeptidase [Algoriphagus namhaensis]|uniref:M23 family metallopeptidase n=1 Tax=Algoriphagus namhaensis TaxID=915353 RepID=A0ABV8AU90_9BACT